jgi:acetaldehyde dehydrogenase / alcohol dehydrogenase
MLNQIKLFMANVVVGQSAKAIAKMIDVKVPKSTVVLAAEESRVGKDVPLSYEKLSPIIAVYRAADFAAAVDLCEALTLHGGIGHTAGIYSNNTARLEIYASRIPAGR